MAEKAAATKSQRVAGRMPALDASDVTQRYAGVAAVAELMVAGMFTDWPS